MVISWIFENEILCYDFVEGKVYQNIHNMIITFKIAQSAHFKESILKMIELLNRKINIG